MAHSLEAHHHRHRHRHRHHSNSLITIHVCLAGSNVSTTTSRNLWLYFPLADLPRHEQFHSSHLVFISLSIFSTTTMSSSLLSSDIAHQAPYAIDTSTIDVSLNHLSARPSQRSFSSYREVFYPPPGLVSSHPNLILAKQRRSFAL